MCVCPLTLSRLNRLAYGHEIWYSYWPWKHLGQVQWSRSEVKGQGHQVKKRYFQGFLIWVNRYKTDGLWCDVMTSRDVMVWHCVVMSWRRDIMWHRFGTREVHQHFSVFLFIIKNHSGQEIDFYWSFTLKNTKVLLHLPHAERIVLAAHPLPYSSSKYACPNRKSMLDRNEWHCQVVKCN